MLNWAEAHRERAVAIVFAVSYTVGTLSDVVFKENAPLYVLVPVLLGTAGWLASTIRN